MMNGSCALTDASMDESYYLTSAGTLKKRTVLTAETKKNEHQLGGKNCKTRRDTQIKVSSLCILFHTDSGLLVGSNYE